MSVTKYTDLFNEVLPEVPGVPQPLALNAIRNTVIAFCAGTDIWRQWLDPIDVECGVNTYDIPLDAGTDLVTLLSVKCDGDKLTPRNEDQLDDWNPRWRTELNLPRHYMMQNQESVVLACVPDRSSPGGLLLSVSLQPERTSTSFPGWIYSQYWEGITAGAKARLMVMPGKPWSNLQQAGIYQAAFDAEIGTARADAARALVRSRTVSRSTH
ncbi:hypothetical protein [Burkholderia sp. Bp8990]|uniref:phage adaptor protein n=1 Tax=Burkholderia sp. Bp8990 TaxID=2184552 RepID=UPI000F5B5D2D|nr:hypothetical protein [Burkholderia sp. Bp8990]RQS39775.1 hypothetical protein DIE01_16320 [Burkholderia sp. Bp8990]